MGDTILEKDRQVDEAERESTAAYDSYMNAFDSYKKHKKFGNEATAVDVAYEADRLNDIKGAKCAKLIQLQGELEKLVLNLSQSEREQLEARRAAATVQALDAAYGGAAQTQWACLKKITCDGCGKWKRRRLVEEVEPPFEFFEAEFPSEPVARRLAAIPLAEAPGATLPTEPEMVAGQTDNLTDPLPVLGVVSSILCLAGCLVKRYFRQQKARVRRDSFGFLPDSRRNSLTKADLAV